MQKNKTAYNAKVAFTVLTREGKDIPEDLLAAILNEFDRQIDHYEVQHPQDRVMSNEITQRVPGAITQAKVVNMR